MSIEGKGDATLKLHLSLSQLDNLQVKATLEGREDVEVRGYLRLREEGEEGSVLFFVEAGSGRVLFEVVPDIKIIGILR